jgi:hypothetical protein
MHTMQWTRGEGASACGPASAEICSSVACWRHVPVIPYPNAVRIASNLHTLSCTRPTGHGTARTAIMFGRLFGGGSSQPAVPAPGGGGNTASSATINAMQVGPRQRDPLDTHLANALRACTRPNASVQSSSVCIQYLSPVGGPLLRCAALRAHWCTRCATSP